MLHVKRWIQSRKYFLGNNYSDELNIIDYMFHVKSWIQIRKYFPGNNYGDKLSIKIICFT